MKPITYGVSIGLVLIIVQLGNGCAPSFQTIEQDLASLKASSCLMDESTLSSLSAEPSRSGYIGNRQVVYQDRGEGWIQVEGDMMYLTKNGRLPETPAAAGHVSQGVGVSSSDKWPNGRIPYVISGSLPNQQRVVDAINHWHNRLNGVITFVPRTSESDYVLFQTDPNGCAAPVGYFAGYGVHPVALADACGSGNVAHEIGHVVGLDHEQNRHDRDSYVTINSAKVSSGMMANFTISGWSQDYIGYDFGSIMHYGLNAFSVDGSNTIVPKVTVPAGVTVGQRQSLSDSDINTVKAIYGSGTSPTPTPTPSGTGTGLFGHYYNSTDLSSNMVGETVDASIDFAWPDSPFPGVNADNFSVRWDGWLRPAEAGSYSIVAEGQDNFRVTINGAKVIDNMTGTSGYKKIMSGALTLSANTNYQIVVEFVGYADSSTFKLSWRKNGATETVIPTAQMFPNMKSFLSSRCN